MDTKPNKLSVERMYLSTFLEPRQLDEPPFFTKRQWQKMLRRDHREFAAWCLNNNFIQECVLHVQLAQSKTTSELLDFCHDCGIDPPKHSKKLHVATLLSECNAEKAQSLLGSTDQLFYELTDKGLSIVKELASDLTEGARPGDVDEQTPNINEPAASERSSHSHGDWFKWFVGAAATGIIGGVSFELASRAFEASALELLGTSDPAEDDDNGDRTDDKSTVESSGTWFPISYLELFDFFRQHDDGFDVMEIEGTNGAVVVGYEIGSPAPNSRGTELIIPHPDPSGTQRVPEALLDRLSKRFRITNQEICTFLRYKYLDGVIPLQPEYDPFLDGDAKQ